MNLYAADNERTRPGFARRVTLSNLAGGLATALALGGHFLGGSGESFAQAPSVNAVTPPSGTAPRAGTPSWASDTGSPASAEQTASVAAMASMMRQGKVAEAVDAYRRLAHGPNLSPANQFAVDQAGERLVAMGIDATLLKLPPSAFRPLPPIDDAMAISAEAAEMSTSPPAPTRALGGASVAPAIYAGPAPNSGVAPGGIQQASAEGLAMDPGQVAPVQFIDSAGDVAPADEANPANSARESLTAGMQALAAGQKAEARAKFLDAWKNPEGLSEAERSTLKDKLTLLQPRRLGEPTAAKPVAEMTEIEKAALEVQQKTRVLYREVTSELANIEQDKTERPMDAKDALVTLRRRVESADVDDDARRALTVMVDRAIRAQDQYIEINRADIELEIENESVRTAMELANRREAQIDEEVSALVDEYNDLMKQRRYAEATILAKQVAALKPDDPISTSMFHNSRMGTRLRMAEEIEAAKELAFIDNLRDVDASAVAIDPEFPLTMPDAQSWVELSGRRRSNGEADSRFSPAEREIKQRLSSQVDVSFDGRPLGEVLDDLSAITGVPIVMDRNAMASVRVTPESPITLDLNQPLELRSALNLILQNLQLTYMIENDVLMITSVDVKRNAVYPVVYRVAKLVTPIPNFTSSYEDGLAGALRAAYQMTMPQADVQVMPVSLTDLAGGMANQMKPNAPKMNSPNVLGQYHPMGGQGGFGVGGPATAGGGGAGGAAFADFTSLMDLIQTTIEPGVWEALGGTSTMREYPQNLSLVISTTSDIHDQIRDLLESLRRLQNLQITIEVKFITLSDQFAENIGVDFDLQFDDNLTDFPSDDAGPSVTVGIGPDNAFTPDLDIRLDNSLATTPAFGATLSNPTTLGFAILSDIEAYFFLQAAQADTRSNVMQAPKVTLFDGQLATISDTTQRPFVTSITPVVGDFAVAQQPVIVVLNEGTQLNVQGIVSDDKRFVRLTLVPFFSQIGEVDTFTYEGRRTSRRSSRDEDGDTNGDGVVDDRDTVDEEEESDIVEGTTVQLPTFAFTTVSTTVSVPDGGTILLGGIKRLAEGRSETGVPVLSKIPYINRLFRNQAIGRDARSLMLMVTPRIIIEEEEELAQTGFDPRRQ